MYLLKVGADVGLGTAGRFSTAQGIIEIIHFCTDVHHEVN
jgi:hypothetical protein